MTPSFHLPQLEKMNKYLALYPSLFLDSLVKASFGWDWVKKFIALIRINIFCYFCFLYYDVISSFSDDTKHLMLDNLKRKLKYSIRTKCLLEIPSSSVNCTVYLLLLCEKYQGQPNRHSHSLVSSHKHSGRQVRCLDYIQLISLLGTCKNGWLNCLLDEVVQ